MIYTQAQVFNVGNKRRTLECKDQSANFFSADNKECKEMRDKVAFEVLEEALDWLGVLFFLRLWLCVCVCVRVCGRAPL